jgi:hypothetical protein
MAQTAIGDAPCPVMMIAGMLLSAAAKSGHHFKPVHAGHADIGDEAGVVLAPKGFHECVGAGVGLTSIACARRGATPVSGASAALRA